MKQGHHIIVLFAVFLWSIPVYSHERCQETYSAIVYDEKIKEDSTPQSVANALVGAMVERGKGIWTKNAERIGEAPEQHYERMLVPVRGKELHGLAKVPDETAVGSSLFALDTIPNRNSFETPWGLLNKQEQIQVGRELERVLLHGAYDGQASHQHYVNHLAPGMGRYAPDLTGVARGTSDRRDRGVAQTPGDALSNKSPGYAFSPEAFLYVASRGAHSLPGRTIGLCWQHNFGALGGGLCNLGVPKEEVVIQYGRANPNAGFFHVWPSLRIGHSHLPLDASDTPASRKLRKDRDNNAVDGWLRRFRHGRDYDPGLLLPLQIEQGVR